MVATPIGNLKDMTLRAIDTLKAADRILCEDTRRAAILLKAYEIHTATTSFHSYTTPTKRARLLDQLRTGQHFALISDAGLPGISDPGAAFIRDAIGLGIPVSVIPGASASLMGLILSGFPTDRFVFEGFLPIKSGARRNRLKVLKAGEPTAILYESPHRLLKTLADIHAVYGDIPISCSRELTKLFEETRREPVSRLSEHFRHHPPKGEFVLVIPPGRLRRHGE